MLARLRLNSGVRDINDLYCLGHSERQPVGLRRGCVEAPIKPYFDELEPRYPLPFYQVFFTKPVRADVIHAATAGGRDAVSIALPLHWPGYGIGSQLLGGVGKNITSITMADFCGFKA